MLTLSSLKRLKKPNHGYRTKILPKDSFCQLKMNRQQRQIKKIGSKKTLKR